MLHSREKGFGEGVRWPYGQFIDSVSLSSEIKASSLLATAFHSLFIDNIGIRLSLMDRGRSRITCLHKGFGSGLEGGFNFEGYGISHTDTLPAIENGNIIICWKNKIFWTFLCPYSISDQILGKWIAKYSP